MSSVKNLYVGNLPFGTTSSDLEQVFGQYGTVTKAQVITDRETGRSRGFGFVEMSSGAEEAIQAMNGADFQGRRLTVNEAKPREERPRGGGGYGGGGGRGGYGGGGGRGGYGGGGGGYGGGRDRY
jgi:RNA recognition motif-containing protein